MAGTGLCRLCGQGLRVEISSMRWNAIGVRSGGVTLLFLGVLGLSYGTQDLSWCDVRSSVAVQGLPRCSAGLSSCDAGSL